MTEPGRPSTTALGVAGLRAAHLLLDDEPPILDDTVAIRLLGPEAADGIREHAERFGRPVALGLRSHVLIRSRYAEDTLAGAFARGTRQYLILGAGLDTFAYRQPTGMADLRIFEVDLPATQASKRARLAEAGIQPPLNAIYVPADLTDPELLPHLVAAGFDATRPAVATLLGVTVYLPAEAVLRLYATLARLAPDSDVVMTFSQPRAAGQPDVLADAAAAAGEPWQTRTTPEQLVRDLRAAGFATAEIVDPLDLWMHHFEGRTDGLKPSSRANLAHASTGPTGPSALMPPSENGA